MANMLGLFFGNVSEIEVLREQVGPLRTYGGRLVPILHLLCHGKGGNMLVLERPPAPELLVYFKEQLGLGLPEIEILPANFSERLKDESAQSEPDMGSFLDRLRSHPATWLDGFVTDENLERLAEHLGKRTICAPQASWRGNNKFLLHHYLAMSGLPIFDTEVAAHPSEVGACLRRLRDRGYERAAIKAQIGASGIGLIKVSTAGGDEIPTYLFYEGPCLVQGWLDGSVPSIEPKASPSVQLFLDDDSLTLYDLTDQILSAESVHEGNIAPAPSVTGDEALQEDLLRQAEKAGTWLHAQGYRGTASVDFHLVNREDRGEARICEINARVTGATYPSILARHFRPGGVWLMRNMRLTDPLPAKSFLAILERSGLLFRPSMNSGIFPINFNLNATDLVVKAQLLCLGDAVDEVWNILGQARELLPTPGEFDRD